MENLLIATAIQARTMQLYYHYCHNLVSGPSFLTDHEFLGSVYGELESDYDVLVEYFISTYGVDSFSSSEITKAVMAELLKFKVEDMDCDKMFSEALALEKKYQVYLGHLDKAAPIGLKNRLGQIAENSDIRKYKIQQRLLHKPGISLKMSLKKS